MHQVRNTVQHTIPRAADRGYRPDTGTDEEANPRDNPSSKAQRIKCGNDKVNVDPYTLESDHSDEPLKDAGGGGGFWGGGTLPRDDPKTPKSSVSITPIPTPRAAPVGSTPKPAKSPANPTPPKPPSPSGSPNVIKELFSGRGAALSQAEAKNPTGWTRAEGNAGQAKYVPIDDPKVKTLIQNTPGAGSLSGWRKAYMDGFDAMGNPVSFHYFVNVKTDQVFNPKFNSGISNPGQRR